MPFFSFEYLLGFLPVVVVLHAIARRTAGAAMARGVLLVASLAFYGWFRPSHLPLLLGSIVFNWGMARAIAAAPWEGPRRKLLIVALAANLVFLSLFKYLNFALGSIEHLGGPSLRIPDWGFPLGISFFTLQQVAYLMDCYEELIAPNSLVDHAEFVSFFCYVTSGPIARAKSIVPQLRAASTVSGSSEKPAVAPFQNVSRGLYLFAIGLFKKAIFADSFARVADVGFGAPGNLSTLEAWIFATAYGMQLYFDFSGYSDMAVGSAAMLGIELPRNFDTPFRSRSIIEFWQRWHITLSNFIATYLYTPILRIFDRPTLAAASVATMVSMTIAGLWHGPAWTFVIFGTLHGVALVVNRYWKKTKRTLPPLLALILTLMFLDLGFVFFRAPSLADALAIAGSLLPSRNLLSLAVLATVRREGLITLVPPVLFGLIAAFAGPNSDELARDFRRTRWSMVATALLLLTSMLFLNSKTGKPFVYFAF